MSNNIKKDKKNKPLSASSLCKTASKYTTRSQTADKGTNSRQTRNPDKHTLTDQNIMDQISNVLSEDHNQSNQQIASQTVYDTIKRMEQKIAELKTLLLESRRTIASFSEQRENTDKMADLRHNNSRESYFLSTFDPSNNITIEDEILTTNITIAANKRNMLAFEIKNTTRIQT